MKHKSRTNMILLILIIVLAAALTAMLLYMQSPSYQVERQLSLGAKYLEQGEYDQAILTYSKAVSIAPKSREIDSNIGLANAYVSKAESLPQENAEQILQNYENAIEVYDYIIDITDGSDTGAIEAAIEVSEQQIIVVSDQEHGTYDEDKYNERIERYKNVLNPTDSDPKDSDPDDPDPKEPTDDEEDRVLPTDIVLTLMETYTFPVEISYDLEQGHVKIHREYYEYPYDYDSAYDFMLGILPQETAEQKQALIFTILQQEMDLDDTFIALSESPLILSKAIRTMESDEGIYYLEINDYNQLMHIEAGDGNYMHSFGSGYIDLNYNDDGSLSTIRTHREYEAVTTFTYDVNGKLTGYDLNYSEDDYYRISITDLAYDGELLTSFTVMEYYGQSPYNQYIYLEYDQEGRISEMKFYDDTNTYSYSICFEYEKYYDEAYLSKYYSLKLPTPKGVLNLENLIL